jgi:tRNA threonylcarbamoyladenosine biosynthesis protein TsaB
MQILGIDTATRTASVGLVSDLGIIGEYTLQVEKVHSKKLMPMIDQLLTAVGMTVGDVSGLAISAGPGSFTGLRIGMAAAKGLAFALDVPIVGVSTLEALVLPHLRSDLWVCGLLDARMGEVYGAVYTQKEGRTITVIKPQAVLLEHLLAELIGSERPVLFCGEGALRFSDQIKMHLGETALFPTDNGHHLRGTSVAIIGRREILDGRTGNMYSLAPGYLRRSQAEILWDGREARR